MSSDPHSAERLDDAERQELELLRAQRATLLQMLTHIDGVGDRHNGPYTQCAWVTSDTVRDILGAEERKAST